MEEITRGILKISKLPWTVMRRGENGKIVIKLWRKEYEIEEKELLIASGYMKEDKSGPTDDEPEYPQTWMY